jgi:hypothetical protein
MVSRLATDQIPFQKSLVDQEMTDREPLQSGLAAWGRCRLGFYDARCVRFLRPGAAGRHRKLEA